MIRGMDVSSIDHHLAFQFNITGDGAGAFYAEVKEGHLSVEPYDYKDRDALFTATADTYIKLISGRLDPIAAYTFGKIKIEGDLGRALEIIKLLK